MIPIITFTEIVGTALVIAVGALGLGFYIARVIRQYICPHSSYYENRACDAVCNKCGKNLGFIGNLRQPGSGHPL